MSRVASSISSRGVLNPTRCGFNDGKYYSNAEQYFDTKNFDAEIAPESNEDNKQSLIGLLDNLRNLLYDAQEENGYYDVVFKVRASKTSTDPGEPLKAHKQILIARSAIFESLFKGEKVNGFELINVAGVDEITVPDSLYHNLLYFLLHYIYWGYVAPTPDESFGKDVFEHASLFDLKELRRSTGDSFFEKQWISHKNVLDYLKLAKVCGCKNLKKRTIDYIVDQDNRKRVMENAHWEAFVKDSENKELIKDIYNKIATL